ncbi:SDR family oxidoreductase, partial [Vibrio parahaemolyticus]
DAAERLFAALDPELVRRTGKQNFDILVNNAGIAAGGDFEHSTVEQLDEIYMVNLRSLYAITQQAAKRLNNGGRIISTSSIVSRTP